MREEDDVLAAARVDAAPGGGLAGDAQQFARDVHHGVRQRARARGGGEERAGGLARVRDHAGERVEQARAWRVHVRLVDGEARVDDREDGVRAGAAVRAGVEESHAFTFCVRWGAPNARVVRSNV